MSPEKQRIAIARACGWTKCRIEWGFPVGNRNNDVIVRDIPDYLNDLNAMHEAEKKLTGQKIDAYVTTLCLKVQPAPSLWNATAAQRAEAFLRTLGLWEDDK